MKQYLKLFLVISMAIIFSACGRGDNDAEINGQATNGATTIGGARSPDATVLTVSVSMGNRLFTQAADSFMEHMAAQGQDVYVELITHGFHERDEHYERLLGMFAAGIGPDVFLQEFNLPLNQFIRHGFIADIYNLIDQSSTSSRDDFFTNTLEGLEVDGRLYALPLQSDYEFVGINANVPPEFLARFAALDHVSVIDLMEIYTDIVNNHPQFSGFSFAQGLHPIMALMPEINNGIDFANQSVNLNTPEMVNLLDEILRISTQEYEDDVFTQMWEITEDDLVLLQERYIFYSPMGPDAIFEASLEFENTFFVNFLPVADSMGRVVNRTWGQNIVVSQTADAALAWAFVEHLISTEFADSDFRWSASVPIKRRYFRPVLEHSLDSIMINSHMRPFLTGQHNAIEQAITRLETITQMPSVTDSSSFLLPSMNWEALMTFFGGDGEQSAHDVLAAMEAEILEVLLEEREITPYIPTIEVDPFADDPRPVQSISAFIPGEFSGAFRQAILSMNEDWYARGMPYRFHVEIEAQDMMSDWEERQARQERFQVELMAGQGPDIFIPDAWELQRFVDSGLLADIYTLMDNCTVTSRADFFAEPLKALETNGRLHVLPISFGFMYMGINMDIPQPFIDRYAAMDTISVTEKMRFYADFKAAHGDEFGNLNFMGGGMFSFDPHSILSLGMASYIDFSTRQADLTNPNFISFLEFHQEFFNDWEWPSGMGSSWMMPINGASNLRDRARSHLFEIEFAMLGPANAFFTPADPIFYHYIPVTDDAGRLLFSVEGGGSIASTWANLCFTAQGNEALAWEFTLHLIDAFTNPQGVGATNPTWGGPVHWGQNSLVAPVRRSLFHDHASHGFYLTLTEYAEQAQSFVGVGTEAEIQNAVTSAVNRMTGYKERPTALMRPLMPWGLGNDATEQFNMGLITAETAAQRMQNSVALWLIE